MRKLLKIALCCFALLTLVAADVQAEEPNSEHFSAVSKWLASQMEQVTARYVEFHQNPELSFQEEQTAIRFSKYLSEAGYEVTNNIGGYGVIAILKNGDGPTLLLRSDLDGLPVTETTPLPFASKVTVELPDGSKTGVMHACGHDVHMTNLITVAKYLSEHKSNWSGTLILIGQPAEERGSGARAMLKDGLFTKFPKPDFAIAFHVAGDFEAGKVKLTAGPAFANVDSVDIVMKGRGGHGSAPHRTIDPIVQASELVMSLQTIVSREVDPAKPAVVTVGSIHGGTKHNIIGNDCRLQLTVRSYTDDVRQHVLDAIKRKVRAIASAYNAPEPEVAFSEGTPSLNNDAQLAARMRTVFEQTIGAEHVMTDEPSMGGEDFSEYGLAGVPILMYRVGTVDSDRMARYNSIGAKPPSLHSSDYYPDFETTIRTSVVTMTAAALEVLKKSQ